jgi:hypothetical protein
MPETMGDPHMIVRMQKPDERSKKKDSINGRIAVFYRLEIYEVVRLTP